MNQNRWVNRVDQPNGYLSNYFQETLKLVELVDVCPCEEAVTVAVAMPTILYEFLRKVEIRKKKY